MKFGDFRSSGWSTLVLHQFLLCRNTGRTAESAPTALPPTAHTLGLPKFAIKL